MKRIIFLFCLFCILFNVSHLQSAETPRRNELLVLCYHDISIDDIHDNYFTVSQKKFMQQLQFLQQHGYVFVSVQEVIASRAGQISLPDRAVLLTFDDAYRSFYTFVYPTLKRLGYPSMLAVVGKWAEQGAPPADLGSTAMMTWKEIAEVSRSGLVEIASHSYNLHTSIQYTPAGNVAAAATSREYKAEQKRYETEQEYHSRIAQDFSIQRQLFMQYLGKPPRVVVWPYGRYNAITMEVAKNAGVQMAFNLGADKKPAFAISDVWGINRIIVDNWDTDFFANIIRNKGMSVAEPIRAAQVDLDLIYDPESSAVTEKNLGKLIERLVEMGVNTVFLQAFNDSDASGNIKSVYFYNRVLPVKADIFSHAAHQLSIRGMAIYAWMPTLSVVFPDEDFNDKYQVREYKDGQIIKTNSWYKRLTPFSAEVRKRVAMLYEDLAVYTQIAGILFQDDAYLNDYEDMHPLAVKAFAKAMNMRVNYDQLIHDEEIQQKWTAFKREELNSFLDELAHSVLRFRPECSLARNIYAESVLTPDAETWFAQRWQDYLEKYDYSVIMAYPKMEKSKNDQEWLQRLVKVSLQDQRAYTKAIFKLQTYDWAIKQWLNSNTILEEMRTVLASGARNLAYYPDNVWNNAPQLERVRLEMSTRSVPK